MDTNSAPTTHLRTRPQIGVEEPLETSDRAERRIKARNSADRRQHLASQDALKALATNAQFCARAERVDAQARCANTLTQSPREDLRVAGAHRSVVDQRSDRPIATVTDGDVLTRGALTLGSGHNLQPTGRTTQSDLPYSPLVLQDHISMTGYPL